MPAKKAKKSEAAMKRGMEDRKLDLWFLLILGGIGLFYSLGFLPFDAASARYFSYAWPVLVIMVALIRLTGSRLNC